MADFLINLPAQGPPGIPGVPGTPGSPGDVGPRGPAIAVRWNHVLYDAGGPIIGTMMLDLPHGQLLFERHERTGNDVTNWLSTIGSSTNPSFKGYLMAVEVLDDSRWMLFNVINSSVEYTTGKYQVPVTLNSGSVGVFDDGAEVAFNFSRAGNKGLDGAGGNMFGANNLSELTAPAAAFDRIKQSSTLTYPGVSLFIPNYLTGLNLANATDTDHDITVAIGTATNSTNAVLMRLLTSITKQIDAPWVVGNNVGGLDAGGVGNQAASTWYSLYLIRRPDTGVIDACFSASNTAPTFGANIPVAYTQFRRLGAVKTDSSKNLLLFRQYDDHFMMQKTIAEFTGTVTSSPFLISIAGVPPLPVPPMGIFLFVCQCGPGETVTMQITDPNIPYDINHYSIFQANTTGGIVYGAAEVICRLDSTAHVRLECTAGDRYGVVYAKGWIDRREK